MALILSQFNNNYINLSMQKYSASIIDKCLEKYEHLISKFVKEMEISRSNRIIDLLENRYGDVIVQKMLKVAQQGIIKRKLINVILRNVYVCN